MQRFALLLLLAGTHAAYADPGEPIKVTLSEAVERALSANPSIAAARHRLEAARAEAAMEQARLGVHVSAGIVAGVSDRDAMLEAEGTSSPVPTAMVGRRATAHLAGAAMVPIHTGGALEAQVRRAQAMVAMVEAELQAKCADVVAEVREAFLRARYAAAMVRAAEADRDAAHAMAANARAEWEAGRGIEATYLRAVARERGAERAVAAAESDRDSALIALARAMGQRPYTPITPVGTPDLGSPFADVDQAVRAAMESSPMVLAALARQLWARHHAGVARAARRPQVYGSLMGAIPGLGDGSMKSSAVVGLTVAVPILDGGMRDAAVREAEAGHRAALADVEAMRQTVEAEIRTAWREVSAANASMQAARAAYDAATSAHAVIALRVENQKAILVEQLDALSAVRDAEEAIARAELDRDLALVRILRLTDGAAGSEEGEVRSR